MNKPLIGIFILLILVSIGSALVFHGRALEVQKDFQFREERLRQEIRNLDALNKELESKLLEASQERQNAIAEKRSLETAVSAQDRKIKELTNQIETVRAVLAPAARPAAAEKKPEAKAPIAEAAAPAAPVAPETAPAKPRTAP